MGDTLKRRTRTGCLTCRQRKKKCDELRPSCTGCHRNNLECQWESIASLSTPRRRQRQSRLPEKIPSQALTMLNVFSLLKPDMTSRLLGHFISSSPKWLSTRIGSRRTEFLQWLNPAISESPLVFHCILTIASADLLKYNRRDLELRRAAMEYYGRTVSELRTAIESEIIMDSSNSSLTDHNPLAVLLLCLHETQNFTDKERILPHLNAAVFLLQNRLSYASSNPSLRGLLLEMFCYFFSLAAFSLGPKLTLSRASPIFNSPSVIWLIQHGHIMGTTQHLFITIYRISLLTQNLVSQDPEVASAVRSELQLYDQHLDFLQPNSNPDQNTETGCLHDTVTSELYRIACQIHVKRLLAQDTPEEDDTIQQLVISFIDLLHQLPASSPSQNILSWPLVVAGYSAPTKGYQDLISAKLDQIQSEWRSDVFSKSAAFLRLKWRTDRASVCASSGSATSRSTRALTAQDYISVWNSCPVIMA